MYFYFSSFNFILWAETLPGLWDYQWPKLHTRHLTQEERNH